MARPKKLDYDSDDFYDEIIGIAMQGLTDAEIVDSLADKFGVSLSPEAFSSMKNGCYVNWTETENQRVSRNLVGINFRHPNVMPNFAVWKTITYRLWHRWCCQPRF